MFQAQRIFIFSCLLVLDQTQAQTKKLSVLVLYESRCPDSIAFITQQLGPNYEDLKDYIDVQLVPFGKSHSERNGAIFYCQHGPHECDGNKKQSCVLNQTLDQSAQVKFVVCIMSKLSSRFLKDCAEKAGLSGDIDQCVTSQQGTQLQLDAEKITQQYKLTFVPTIIYKSVFDQELTDSSRENFRGTVCQLLQKDGSIGANQSPCA